MFRALLYNKVRSNIGNLFKLSDLSLSNVEFTKKIKIYSLDKILFKIYLS